MAKRKKTNNTQLFVGFLVLIIVLVATVLVAVTKQKEIFRKQAEAAEITNEQQLNIPKVFRNNRDKSLDASVYGSPSDEAAEKMHANSPPEPIRNSSRDSKR